MKLLWDWWVIGRRPRVIQKSRYEIYQQFASAPVIRARAAQEEPEVGSDSLRFVAIDQEPLDEEPLFI